MTEPPAKRARRVDSSTMWEKNDSHTVSAEQDSEHGRRRSPHPRDNRRDGPREDRRYRSRSRDRNDRRQERSRSRDRRDRDRRDRDRDGRGARDRMRSGSRERGSDRRGYPGKGGKFRERSRSPGRNGTKTRSRSPPPRGPKGDRRPDRKDPRPRDDGRTANGSAVTGRHAEEMEVDFKEDADEDEMEAMMRKSMGFTRFRTTKNTKVPGNDIYGVRKEKKSEYRQYMNRTGGFNRPLSPSR
ncbi:Putative Podospora anserina S mat genomic DNA chromosome 2, supercontig 2 (Fragment) [Penicillium brasilianum]|uniref:Putative Podospora anserina S mat genomic DNA chromosome 2, supercontig 2 n=1 Tax=Penicillium brasilianum TaxID=104259 RepID=A0A0F7TVV9_PENBI